MKLRRWWLTHEKVRGQEVDKKTHRRGKKGKRTTDREKIRGPGKGECPMAGREDSGKVGEGKGSLKNFFPRGGKSN